MFTPFNFHDRDPSRRSVQGVQLELGEGTTKVNYFGGRNKKDVELNAVSLQHSPTKCSIHVQR
jgi:primary-amine oxidase